MVTTTKLNIDLQRPSYPPVVNAVQGDQNTRRLELSLYSGGAAFTLPESVTAALRYLKPDKTKGYYDTMPDGSMAYSISGNTVSILLAPQVLTVAGIVMAQVVLMHGSETISTFGIQILVEEDPSAGTLTSEDYINWLHWIEAELDAYLEQLKVNGEFVGGTVVGSVNMNGNSLYGLPDPVETTQAASMGFVTSQINKAQEENQGKYVSKSYVDAANKATREYVDAKCVKFTVAIPAEWIGLSAPYTQNVYCPGILATDTPHYGVVYNADIETAKAQCEAFACIDDLDTADDWVTFTCFDDKPGIALEIQMEVNR